MKTDVERLSELHEMIAAPWRCEKPVIAAVRGYCFGAGFEFALACDIIVASSDSEFALPEVRLGMIPGSGGTQRLVRRVGIARAKDMIMRGRRISASEAAEREIIAHSVPREEWEESVRKIAEELAALSPLSLKALKAVINSAEETHLSAGLKMEGSAFALLRNSKDFAEGVKAYLEKRSPKFEGR